MTWTTLLASRDVQRHRTSKKELDDIRALVARDLAGANLAALSADRRFATAYNAALLTAHTAIDCTRSDVARDTEAGEILRIALEFRALVEAWIKTKLPNLKGGPSDLKDSHPI